MYRRGLVNLHPSEALLARSDVVLPRNGVEAVEHVFIANIVLRRQQDDLYDIGNHEVA